MPWIGKISLIGVAVSIAIALAQSSIEIDTYAKRIRIVHSLAGFKLGNWIDLSGYHKVIIKNTRGSSSFDSRSGTTTVTVNTFDMFFESELGEELEFHHFTNYILARKTLRVLVKHLDFEHFDYVRENKLRIERSKAARLFGKKRKRSSRRR